MPSWDDFVAFCESTLKQSIRQGRSSLRPSRVALMQLINNQVLPFLSEEDQQRLFPLGYDPEASELKTAAGVALERGLIGESEYRLALLDDLRRSPLAFLQTVSGKTFGESVAPRITRFWIEEPGDQVVKQPGRAYYDLAWRPANQQQSLRIELKASSEAPGYRFQQIRDPRMSGSASIDYDVLLCLGAANAGLEWWVIPALELLQLQSEGVLTNQHGGQKSIGNTLWMTMDLARRTRLAPFSVQSEQLRSRLISLLSS